MKKTIEKRLSNLEHNDKIDTEEQERLQFIIFCVAVFGLLGFIAIQIQMSNLQPKEVCHNETDFSKIKDIGLYGKDLGLCIVVSKDYTEFNKCKNGEEFELDEESVYLFKDYMKLVIKEVCEIK